MAELTASQHHSPTPVPRPRRSRSKSAIQSSANSEQDSHDPRSFQENTKPERPIVPPRPNFSELKKLATRTPHSSTVTHSQVSPSSPKQRQIPTDNQVKSPGSPRSISASRSANALIPHRRKNEQLQRIRSKSNSDSFDSGRSNNGTLKQRQALSNKVSDSGLQSNKSIKSFSSAKVSHSKSFSSPERKRNANATDSTCTGQVNINALQQSPTRPQKPPLPANRPCVASSAASRSKESSPTKQNQRPSRPPTLPKTAATSNTCKIAPLSHLYGSTQSLPAATDGSRPIKVATATPKYFDDKSQSTKPNGSLATAGSGRRLKDSPNKSPQCSYRTLPKDYGRKRGTQELHRLQTTPRRPSDTPQVQGKRAPPASTNAGTTVKLHHSLGGQNNTALSRKTQPQHSKIPPKRPPPVVRDKPHPAVVTKTPHTPPSVDNSTSNPRYTSFTDRIQQPKQQQLLEDHIYMDPHQTDISSWPGEGEGDGTGTVAEYPYVIMNRADSVHIYTPLALDTTDDLEGQVITIMSISYGQVYYTEYQVSMHEMVVGSIPYS